jgi:Na+/proline symporter
MTLGLIDWGIIAVYLAACIAAGLWMRRYIRGVDDFAVAGREMDVNLGIASLAATELGIVTIMYTAQLGFINGPAGATVGVLMALAMLLVGASGFIIGPLREAGVITIPELFQKRFGTKVRWLAGLVVILGGVLNMGIFLRLGGEFLVHVTGMDPSYLQWTMTVLLGIVLVYTVLGGMLSVLVTDWIQFLVMGLGIVITCVLVLFAVGWGELTTGLTTAHEEGLQFQAEQEQQAKADQKRIEAVRKSEGEQAAEQLAATLRKQHNEELLERREELAERGVLVVHTTGDGAGRESKVEAVTVKNPFNPFSSDGLGWMYVAWQFLFQIAVVCTWQTQISRVLSARDAQTAKRMYRRTAFYFVGRFALPGLWGAAAFIYFVNQGGLPTDVTDLTAMPAFLSTLLPMGVIGLLLAAMLAAEMSTDSGYLLTWATVIYNDLISPCFRNPLPQSVRLLIVRSLVLAIGLFLLFYGLWYEIPGNAWDYLAVTGNIYLASVFTLLVGALYWKGSNWVGAMSALVLGAVGPITFLIVNAYIEDPAEHIRPEIAGAASFAMAFAGMFIGSIAGHALGLVDDSELQSETEEKTS